MATCERYRITGRVQGVGFRYAALSEARRLGLAGWVRNRPDGSVEALACGDEPALTRFHDWLRSGPPGARVTRVERHSADDTAPPADFEIR